MQCTSFGCCSRFCHSLASSLHPVPRGGEVAACVADVSAVEAQLTPSRLMEECGGRLQQVGIACDAGPPWEGCGGWPRGLVQEWGGSMWVTCTGQRHDCLRAVVGCSSVPVTSRATATCPPRPSDRVPTCNRDDNTDSTTQPQSTCCTPVSQPVTEANRKPKR